MKRHLTRQEAVIAAVIVALATVCAYYKTDPLPLLIALTYVSVAITVLGIILHAINVRLHQRYLELIRQLEEE